MRRSVISTQAVLNNEYLMPYLRWIGSPSCSELGNPSSEKDVMELFLDLDSDNCVK